ncbi:MAG TPA: GNAT family N-acetyltransferase [Pseudonocardiaceae bacterium]
MTVEVAALRPGHAGELYTLQRAAYVGEAQRYHEPGIPPLAETLDEVRADIASPRVVTLGAWLGSRLVGAVRGRPDGDRMEVARVAVAPDLQGQGIGSRLLAAVEDAAPPGVAVLWLVAASRSDGNVRLYRRVGYRTVGTAVDHLGIELLRMEKRVSVPGPVPARR